MQITNISNAKSSLSKLIEQVLQGQEAIIGKAGKQVATLVPNDAATSKRKLGVGNWRGKIWVSDGCDDLPEETLALFTGEIEEQPTSWRITCSAVAAPQFIGRNSAIRRPMAFSDPPACA